MRQWRSRASVVLAVGMLAGAAGPGLAAGAPIAPGSQGALTTVGGPVYLRFVGSAAALVSEVWFFASNPGASQAPALTGARYLYANTGAQFSRYDHSTAAAYTPPGLATQTVFLGNFARGTALAFGLYVPQLRNPADAPNGRWFYTGTGSQNPDGNIHAQLTPQGGNTTRVGFEDLCKGSYAPGCAGDSPRYQAAWEYNANVFDVQGATVTPEPISMTLFGTGAAGLAFLRRRRRKQQPAD